MGIVVTVFMLLGLLMVSPIKLLNLKQYEHKVSVIDFVGFSLLFAGLWNVLWFGLNHITLFWGLAAMISGVFMILVAIFILGACKQSRDSSNRLKSGVLKIATKLAQNLQPIYYVAVLGLLLSFLLYALTLVRLNLGYSIIA
ncbi:MAG: hypothetical protein ACJAUP_000275 [Cellvibrionaceae bacterium]|jgi:hypothetical protein